MVSLYCSIWPLLTTGSTMWPWLTGCSGKWSWAVTRTTNLRVKTGRMEWALTLLLNLAKKLTSLSEPLWPWPTVKRPWVLLIEKPQEPKTWWRLQQPRWILASSHFFTPKRILHVCLISRLRSVVLVRVVASAVGCMWGVPPMKGSLGQLSYQRPLLTPHTLHCTVLRFWYRVYNPDIPPFSAIHYYFPALCYYLHCTCDIKCTPPKRHLTWKLPKQVGWRTRLENTTAEWIFNCVQCQRFNSVCDQWCGDKVNFFLSCVS